MTIRQVVRRRCHNRMMKARAAYDEAAAKAHVLFHVAAWQHPGADGHRALRQARRAQRRASDALHEYAQILHKFMELLVQERIPLEKRAPAKH